jgi:hypothetical protein
MEEKRDDKKSFRVVDKRVFTEEDLSQESAAAPEADTAAKRETSTTRETATDQPPPLPDVTFSSLVYSLSTSALISLGEIPEPSTEEVMKNLPLAKQTIDILGMLQEKTAGNLTEDETTLLTSVLSDLRMRYVRAIG